MKSSEFNKDFYQYPSEETMKLFLEIGRKLDFFKNGTIHNRECELIGKGYDSINSVDCLSVICEYFENPENKKEKEEFLSNLHFQTKEKVYLTVSKIVEFVWYKKCPNLFTAGTIAIWKEKIGGKEEISINEMIDIPNIPGMLCPEWYFGHKDGILVHEVFEEKLTEIEQERQT